MNYEMWQFSENVLAVRLHERLIWQDRWGQAHVEGLEPIHLVMGEMPGNEAGCLAVVDDIKRRTVQAYVCQEGVLDARWEMVGNMEQEAL